MSGLPRLLQHLLKGKEPFFYPEGTEGSVVAALSGHSESLQDLFLHTARVRAYASEKSPHLDESDWCWTSGIK